MNHTSYSMLVFIMLSSCTTLVSKTEWLTVLVHGAFGFQPNASIKTVLQIKRDCTECTTYEKNVLAMREHPYFSMLQPIQKMGLHPVKKPTNTLSAAYAFGVLFDEVQKLCDVDEKNHFYTFGWSGIISNRRRYFEARELYLALKKEIALFKKRGISLKVRLISYSHGANMVLNLPDIRQHEFCKDTFSIDELYLVGMPIHANTCRQIQHPIFKNIYTLYSHSDSVQVIDISSATHFISHRTFKGCVPKNLTQIELKVIGELKRLPYRCLPPNMRGVINQSPGHIEFWFFGWTPSNYRQNILLYPLPAAVLLPYLICTAKTFDSKNVQITIKPQLETACIRSIQDDCYHERPFYSRWQLAALIDKALLFHPSRPEYKEKFLSLQNSNEIQAYL